MSFIVGLTGGIGSGKSTVADLFSAQGIVVVDTDVIAHELTGRKGLAMPEIAASFGEGVVEADGSLDRNAIRQIIFADPAARKRLENILHPMIRRESEARCQTAESPYVILVVPLLVESGIYRQRVNRVLVVDCEESVQVSRVMARSRLSDAEVRAIMDTQATRSERLAAADDVVINDGDIDSLELRVDDLHREYLRLAAGF